MGTIPLGTSVSPTTSVNSLSLFVKKLPFPSRVPRSTDEPPLSHLPKSGFCRASQVAELFPIVSPEIVVREARLEDCWEVAETHCSSFFPEYSFPLDFMLRIDRLLAMVSGFSVPNGCRRTCLVAVVGSSVDDTFLFGGEDFKVGGFDGKFSKKSVAGILTVDTVADFLPRKGPLRQRRTGIAYISNVAVRERFRRKGIAKRLVTKAEAQARSWGCRSIALHCDLNNPGATKLYKGQGFKCIKVPEGANWPQPRTSPDTKFNFMIKLLYTPTTGDQLAIGKGTGRRLGMGTNMYPSSALLGQNPDESIAALPIDELIEKADGFAGVFPGELKSTNK